MAIIENWIDNSVACPVTSGSFINVELTSVCNGPEIIHIGSVTTDCSPIINTEVSFQIEDDIFGPFASLPASVTLLTGIDAGLQIDITGTVESPTLTPNADFTGPLKVSTTLQAENSCNQIGSKTATKWLVFIPAPPLAFISNVTNNDGTFDLTFDLKCGDGTSVLPGEPLTIEIGYRFEGGVGVYNLAERLTGVVGDTIPAMTSAILGGAPVGWVSVQGFTNFTPTGDGATFIFDDLNHAIASGLTSTGVYRSNAVDLKWGVTVECLGLVSLNTNNTTILPTETLDELLDRPSDLLVENGEYYIIDFNGFRVSNGVDLIETVYTPSGFDFESITSRPDEVINGKEVLYIGGSNGQIYRTEWNGLSWTTPASVFASVSPTAGIRDIQYSSAANHLLNGRGIFAIGFDNSRGLTVVWWDGAAYQEERISSLPTNSVLFEGDNIVYLEQGTGGDISIATLSGAPNVAVNWSIVDIARQLGAGYADGQSVTTALTADRSGIFAGPVFMGQNSYYIGSNNHAIRWVRSISGSTGPANTEIVTLYGSDAPPTVTAQCPVDGGTLGLGNGDTGFNTPKIAQYDGNTIYVADSLNHIVQILDEGSTSILIHIGDCGSSGANDSLIY